MKTTTTFSVVSTFGAGAMKLATMCAAVAALVGAAACYEGGDSTESDEPGETSAAILDAADEAADAEAPVADAEGAPVAQGAERKLAPEEIQRVVRSSFGGFRACYERLLKTSPKAAGKVAVSFRIAEDGTVEDARAESTFADRAIAPCITAHFEGLLFAAHDGATDVTYPLAFSPE